MSLCFDHAWNGSGFIVNVDTQRYARHISLPQVGIEGQQKLADASVLVIGAGGLGSPVLLYLAAAGIGHIGIVDHDRVDVSNLQRQVIHSTSEVGQPKVDSAKKRLLALNPDLNISTFDLQFAPEHVEGIFQETWNAVVDGTDNLPTRYLIDDVCYLKNIPWVYGSIYRFEGQVSVFNVNGGPCYRDLFSEAPPPQTIPSCAEGGVLGVLPGVIGSLQANEVIKLILGLGDVLNGRLLLYDAQAMSFDTLQYTSNPNRTPVVDLSMSQSMFDNEEWCMRVSTRGEVDEGEASANDTMFNSITVQQLLDRRKEGWSPFVLDVRSEGEYNQAHVESTDFQINHESVTNVLESIPQNRDVVVLCRSGMRSQMAAMYLIHSGYDATRLYNLEGGIMAWQATAPNEIVQG
ncbi:MAG: molybdopterin-synthase adenylyltransferase MoeB [Candidatus Poseidoniaceae archaeon]|nr:molybdopterin-synthase adenylyltransferase MoeB [Candidatus Poseidoniaceae archaeon]